ncbi:MAG TPA: hypothetical protein VGP12_09975, partial [Nitrosospira sp.]|nr:hypothetical protein [Nitrosospira sp.]
CKDVKAALRTHPVSESVIPAINHPAGLELPVGAIATTARFNPRLMCNFVSLLIKSHQYFMEIVVSCKERSVPPKQTSLRI